MSTSMNCKGCGAQVVIPDGQRSAKCEYCGLISSLPESQKTVFVHSEEPEPPDAAALIRKAYVLMKKDLFREAAVLIEQSLALEAENASAYIAQLLALLRLTQEDELPNSTSPLTMYESFDNALRFSSPEQKNRLLGYNQKILQRIQAEQQAKLEFRRKTKKALAVIGIVAAIIVAIALTVVYYAIPQDIYNQATDYAAQGDTSAAISLFSDIPNFKDTKAQLSAIGSRTYEDGNLSAAALAWRTAGNTQEMQKFENLLSAGPNHIVGVQPDGTVLAAGNNDSGQCDVSGWSDIQAVSAGMDFTIGLKKDGTLLASGGNKYGQCDVSEWSDIVQIDTGNYYTLGLKSDGTVLAAGDNSDGRCDVSGWSDITCVTAANYFSVGVKSNGTVVAVGENEDGQCDVSGWRDIVSVAAGTNHTVGLQSNGTLIAAGSNLEGQCNVSHASQIVLIDAAAGYTVAMKSDGYIGRTGHSLIDSYIYDPDMITISADYGHAYGLKEDGSVYMDDDLTGVRKIDWNLFSIQSNASDPETQSDVDLSVSFNSAINDKDFAFTSDELMNYLYNSRTGNTLQFEKRHIYDYPDYTADWAHTGGIQIIAYTDPANQSAHAISLKLDADYLGSESEKYFLFYLEKILELCNAGKTQSDIFSELGLSSYTPSPDSVTISSNNIGIDFTWYNDSLYFKIYPDSTALDIETLPVILEPSADFLYDKERRDEFRKLNLAYDYPALLDMAEEYIAEYQPNETDNVYEILNLAQSASSALENCTIEREDDTFNESTTTSIYYNGIEDISPEVNLLPYISQERFTVLAGFIAPDWLNSQDIMIKVGKDNYITAALDDTIRKETASGVMEYGELELNDDELDKIINAESPILRFTGENGETKDHAITQEEQSALSNIKNVQSAYNSLFMLWHKW